MPEGGFLWISLERDELPDAWPLLQKTAQEIGGSPLLDLHCRDMANASHASYYDYTSVYELVIFRRLATQQEVAQGLQDSDSAENGNGGAELHKHHGRSAFACIHPLTVGFAVFDQLLISVHPKGCHEANNIIRRLQEDTKQAADSSVARNRLPTSPADLTLRMINVMVDGYLEIRKPLNAQIKHWQTELLNTHVRFTQWSALMEARSQLGLLEELCDEQHDAMQEWLEALREQPLDAFHPDPAQALMRQDQLNARARDVVEHIDRVLRHAQRMEQTAETAVQIHFSAQGNRTNDIMLVLTTITAIFLPLNLITGVFGMNFRVMPLLDHVIGFWIAVISMVLIALVMGLWFWRKRYLAALD